MITKQEDDGRAAVVASSADMLTTDRSDEDDDDDDDRHCRRAPPPDNADEREAAACFGDGGGDDFDDEEEAGAHSATAAAVDVAPSSDKHRQQLFESILNTDWEHGDCANDAASLQRAVLAVLQELKGAERVADAGEEEVHADKGGGVDNDDDDKDDDEEEGDEDERLMLEGGGAEAEGFVERSRFIPLRLWLEERKIQRLVDNVLRVSAYTDVVDRPHFAVERGGGVSAAETAAAATKRAMAMSRKVFAMMAAVLTSMRSDSAVEAVARRELAPHGEMLRHALEVLRRHRLANPETLRADYTRLVCLLQDSLSPPVVDMLGFDSIKPLRTVHRLLAERNALALLRDPLVATATREIRAHGRERADVQADIREKERAVERLARRYGTMRSVYNTAQLSSSAASASAPGTVVGLTAEEVRHALYSIADNNVYLRFARDPCEQMIEWLQRYFSAGDAPASSADSLAILSGRGGARLTHDHQRQYNYVLQTLWLWREVLNDMYKLLVLAEDDLLSTSAPYELRNTGQGVHRVQRAPRLKREMETIVRRVRRRVKKVFSSHSQTTRAQLSSHTGDVCAQVPSWVGSDVVHLGDHNVPNALMFIDKYAQVPRILLPLTTTLRLLDSVSDEEVGRYIERGFGSVEGAKREILRDFYRHAFDGSGADNFFDAGSCIDGRLTSAWHWCNEIEHKRFFPLFLLAGFTGFDVSV